MTGGCSHIDVPSPSKRAGSLAHDFPATGGSGPYRIFLYVPPGAAPDGGWPVLLTTDGNATFELAVTMMRTQALDQLGSNVAEGVVAAIGYPTEALYDQVGRCWDLTPPPGRTYSGADGTELRTGGAETFLTFLADEILPWLSRMTPISRRRRTLFGHSFGGLFSLFALYKKAHLFTTYVAASPSLYWEGEVIKRAEDAFFASDLSSIEAHVLLSAGEWEGSALAPYLRGDPQEPERQARLDQIAKIERASELMRRFTGVRLTNLRCSMQVHAGENHMSALPVALNQAIRAAFASNRSR